MPPSQPSPRPERLLLTLVPHADRRGPSYRADCATCGRVVVHPDTLLNVVVAYASDHADELLHDVEIKEIAWAPDAQERTAC